MAPSSFRPWFVVRFLFGLIFIDVELLSNVTFVSCCIEK